MALTLTSLLPAAPSVPPVLLLPGDRFFVRRIELSLEVEAGEQVELGLEGMSPFAVAQLYFGHVREPGGGAALVYAAYRRRFAGEETEGWAGAARVLPEFLAWVGAKPDAAGGVVVHEGSERLTALAWRAEETLPGVVLVREAKVGTVAGVAEEARVRAGLSAGVVVKTVKGEPGGEWGDEGALLVKAGGSEQWRIEAAGLDGADIREDDFLEARKQEVKRDGWLWRAVQGCAILLLLALLLEGWTGFMKWQAGSRLEQGQAQAAEVEGLETARTLANRIAELGENRLMPFEMLLAINERRPESIRFQQTVTRGVNELEIEARTDNAADVGAYESVLRENPAVLRVLTRNIRARDGVTTFVLSLVFRPEVLKSNPGSGGDL